MATATFNELGHVYQLDGKTIPSVTQVLELAGLSDVSGIPAHILARASAIGTAVHEATQFLDEGDLAPDSLDPLIAGYVVAYQRFKEEVKPDIELVEHRTITSTPIRYGMCVDRVYKLDGRLIVADLKTSSKVQPHWALQTAAYAVGLRMNDADRWVIHLAKDGTYRVVKHENLADSFVWSSALTVAYWRLENGAKLRS